MVTITAKVRLQSGKAEEFIEAYRWMKPQVMKDPGAILYNLHRSSEDPDVFVFYEQYDNPEAIEYHLSTDHFKTLAARIDPLMAAPGEISHWGEVL
jgi:quinol monooxygenase YgiN